MCSGAITCDEIIDTEVKLYNKKKTIKIQTNFNEKKLDRKMQNLYILLGFLFISIALLITVSIYCYLIKYRPKQKQITIFRYK